MAAAEGGAFRSSRLVKNEWGQVEVAPEKQTRELRTTLLPFELFWAPIAQCLMQALAVIEPLDIVLNGHLCLSLRLKLPMPHQFILQGTEKTFHRRIVVAVALPTHAGNHSATR